MAWSSNSTPRDTLSHFIGSLAIIVEFAKVVVASFGRDATHGRASHKKGLSRSAARQQTDSFILARFKWRIEPQVCLVFGARQPCLPVTSHQSPDNPPPLGLQQALHALLVHGRVFGVSPGERIRNACMRGPLVSFSPFFPPPSKASPPIKYQINSTAKSSGLLSGNLPAFALVGEGLLNAGDDGLLAVQRL